MDEMFKCLGISSRIQQEAVRLLDFSRPRFMESEQFRYKLVSSLAPVRIKKVNVAIDALVEQKLIMRRAKGDRHEIGLNKEIWRLSSETISLIRDATTSIAESMLIDSDFCHTLHDVKLRFRKLGGACRHINEAAFEILVSRYLACKLPTWQRLNADKEIARTLPIATDNKELSSIHEANKGFSVIDSTNQSLQRWLVQQNPGGTLKVLPPPSNQKKR